MLIGDVVYVIMLYLVFGVCIGIEDVLVLVDELVCNGNVLFVLLVFEECCWECCCMVVENLVWLGEIEVGGGDKDEYLCIMCELYVVLV